MRNLFCKIGLHRFDIQISEYLSFNYRRIYSKCKCCGKIKTQKIPFDYTYPIKTNWDYEVQDFKKTNNC